MSVPAAKVTFCCLIANDPLNSFGVLQVIPDSGDLTQDMLDNLNVEQARDENRHYLDKVVLGIDALVAKMGSNIQTGLSADQVLVMRERFGHNEFPQSPMEGFFALLFDAFQDPTLLILISAACVSLGLGIWQEGSEHGWIEGAAILIAVFIVANVSAGNDYTKELQFRALEATSQADERASVLRGGVIERINPKDIVIGDILILQVTLIPFAYHPPLVM